MSAAQIMTKITAAPSDTYVLFYSPICGYSLKALQLLREKKLAYKGYDVATIGMQPLLAVLNANADTIGFRSSHTTKPIIFYNGKFVGGYTELASKLV